MTSSTMTSEIESVEEWLAELDPAEVSARDTTYSRRIITARERLEQANAELRRVVAEARAVGESWTVIGMALGTTRQAAQQRFGTTP